MHFGGSYLCESETSSLYNTNIVKKMLLNGCIFTPLSMLYLHIAPFSTHIVFIQVLGVNKVSLKGVSDWMANAINWSRHCIYESVWGWVVKRSMCIALDLTTSILTYIHIWFWRYCAFALYRNFSLFSRNFHIFTWMARSLMGSSWHSWYFAKGSTSSRWISLTKQ